MNIKIFTLLFLSLSTISLLQGEDVEQNTQSNTPKSNNTSASQLPVGDSLIPNPIVNKEDKHGQLFRYAYDAKHLLFPVKIISIDGWLLPKLSSVEANTLELLLAPGEHQLAVVPDFKAVEPAKVFMGFPWQIKHIKFNVTEGQQIAVGARLLDVKSLEWTLQLYRVEIPIDVESEDGEVTTDQTSSIFNEQSETANHQSN